MPKVFKFRGYDVEELKKMSIDEFGKLLTSRERRSLKRGLTDQQRKLLDHMRKNPEKFHKTHVRDMIILPEMIGIKVGVYRGGAKKVEGGKEGMGKWASLFITPEMVGKRLGEFSIPVQKVKHSAPGIGATRGSKFIATK